MSDIEEKAPARFTNDVDAFRWLHDDILRNFAQSSLYDQYQECRGESEANGLVWDDETFYDALARLSVMAERLVEMEKALAHLRGRDTNGLSTYAIGHNDGQIAVLRWALIGGGVR